MAKAKSNIQYPAGIGLYYNSAPYDFRSKSSNVSMYVNYMLNRSRHIFKWSNLPDTITERTLELYIQIYGYAAIVKVYDNLYVMSGGLGGEPNPEYMPTIFTYANPALNTSASLKIGEECIIIPNDSTYMGMLPMYKYFATLDVETDISFKRMLVNMRKLNVISSNNDRTTASAREYLNRIDDGDDGIIAEPGLVDALRVQPTNSPDKLLTDLIEFKQYNKASWYNFIGLNANYNMKRESLNSNETQLNDDMLFPLVDDMLEMRKNAADEINRLFGTNISVELASTWADNKEIKDLELENMDNDTTEEVNNDEQPDTASDNSTE